MPPKNFFLTSFWACSSGVWFRDFSRSNSTFCLIMGILTAVLAVDEVLGAVFGEEE